jgi:hypothetical protein
MDCTIAFEAPGFCPALVLFGFNPVIILKRIARSNTGSGNLNVGLANPA